MKFRIGMIGYKFMGKAHSEAYRSVPMHFPNTPAPIMKVICGRDGEAVAQAAKQFGWEEAVTDWQELLKRDDIDVIDINAPSNAHKDIAIAAARAGKHVFCEKPLALSLADSREMLAVAEAAGIKQKSIAGSGSHGDLGAHLIDMARFLVGEFDEVIGMSETFIKERPIASAMTGLSGAKVGKDAPRGAVDVDDATLFLTRFTNGALGSFEATRFAAGHRCTNSFEINGSKGSVKFDFERMNELQVYFTDDAEDVQGFRRVLATDPAHAYMEHWWPAGHTIGYGQTFTHEVVELMEALEADRQPVPNFVDGVKCQEVLAAVERSIDERRWVKISEM